MNLETNQAEHQYFASQARNVSASNDAQQMKHDMNEMLIKGAEVAAKGRSNGWSDDLTVAIITEQARRNQKRQILGM